jgi:hypothetical protein
MTVAIIERKLAGHPIHPTVSELIPTVLGDLVAGV